MGSKLLDTFKQTADQIAFLDRGYGIGKPDVQSAIEKVYREINRATPTLQIINVEDFGAVGDGVTDDTPAFVSAMAELQSMGGGILLIPAGKTYRTNADQFPNSDLNNVVVYAYGATIKATDNSRGRAFQIRGNNNVILGGTFDGNFLDDNGNVKIENDGLPGTQTALSVGMNNNLIVRDVFVRNAVNDGIAGNRVFNSVFENITVENCGEHAIYLSFSSDVVFENIKAINPNLASIVDKPWNKPGCLLKLRSCSNINVNHFYGEFSLGQTAGRFSEGVVNNVVLRNVTATGLLTGPYWNEEPDGEIVIEQDNIHLENVHFSSQDIVERAFFWIFGDNTPNNVSMRNCKFEGFRSVRLYGTVENIIIEGGEDEPHLFRAKEAKNVVYKNCPGYINFDRDTVIDGLSFVGETTPLINRLSAENITIKNFTSHRDDYYNNTVFEIRKTGNFTFENCSIENWRNLVAVLNESGANSTVTLKNCHQKGGLGMVRDIGYNLTVKSYFCTTDNTNYMFEVEEGGGQMYYAGLARFGNTTAVSKIPEKAIRINLD